jgi:hypothetical protein
MRIVNGEFKAGDRVRVDLDGGEFVLRKVAETEDAAAAPPAEVAAASGETAASGGRGRR